MDAPSTQAHAQPYSESPAENYQRYFVESIGGPLAEDLIETAELQAGERVLDIACGTGVVTRLAAERVGPSGTAAGLDAHPGMLAVARASTPSGVSIDWYEAGAEAMPLPDEAAALRDMRRVLNRNGRVYVTAPGPTPPLFGMLTEALERHIGPQAAAFCDVVFSLHDAADMTNLMRDAGFREVDVQVRPKPLRLPAPADFLWQYLYSTPLAEPVSKAGAERRTALEREVCSLWQTLVVDGGLPTEVGMTTAAARK